MQQSALWRPVLQAACFGFAAFLALVALQPDMPTEPSGRKAILILDGIVGLLVALGALIG
jgi:hypothetical protein